MKSILHDVVGALVLVALGAALVALILPILSFMAVITVALTAIAGLMVLDDLIDKI